MYISAVLLSVLIYMSLVEILNDWERSEYLPKELEKTSHRVLIGKGKSGKFYHNFLKYHNMLIAGHTGYGKTNLIKCLIEQLRGEIVLIDLKNGFDYPSELVKAREIDEASEVLWEVVGRMRERRKSHIYVIVDEAYELVVPKWARTKEEKDPYFKCQHAISEITRLGRSFKVHLIVATQYPTKEVIDGQLKQNMESRVVFRLPTEVASRVALDEKGAEELPAGVSGRCIYKTDRKYELQTYKYYEEGENWDDHESGTKKKERTRDIIEIG